MSVFMIIAVLFLGFLLILAAIGYLPWLVFFWYGLFSLLTFFIYRFDKTAARNQHWRVAEQSLHWLGLLGGWPGAAWAQQRYRHKLKKTAFMLVFVLTVLLNLALLLLAFKYK
jgi:uncharacterized membrane protein YsdA (DUF1294 family)